MISNETIINVFDMINERLSNIEKKIDNIQKVQRHHIPSKPCYMLLKREFSKLPVDVKCHNHYIYYTGMRYYVLDIISQDEIKEINHENERIKEYKIVDKRCVLLYDNIDTLGLIDEIIMESIISMKITNIQNIEVSSISTDDDTINLEYNEYLKRLKI